MTRHSDILLNNDILANKIQLYVVINCTFGRMNPRRSNDTVNSARVYGFTSSNASSLTLEGLVWANLKMSPRQCYLRYRNSWLKILSRGKAIDSHLVERRVAVKLQSNRLVPKNSWRIYVPCKKITSFSVKENIGWWK